MIYGSKQLKNGKMKAELRFNTGKKIMLNWDEKIELEDKIKEWQMYEKMKAPADQWPGKGKHRVVCFFEDWESTRDFINKLPDHVETAYIAI